MNRIDSLYAGAAADIWLNISNVCWKTEFNISALDKPTGVSILAWCGETIERRREAEVKRKKSGGIKEKSMPMYDEWTLSCFSSRSQKITKKHAIEIKNIRTMLIKQSKSQNEKKQ